MTLPRLAVMNARWAQSPPLSITAVAIAQALGFKAAKPRGEARVNNSGTAKELFDLLGGAGFATEKPAWLTAATT